MLWRALLQALTPRSLLRGVWTWVKQKLVFWILISPVVFAIATVWHVYQQAFVVGGWNDAPGVLIQPDVWARAAARWTGMPAIVTGTVAFLRSAGLGSFSQLFSSLHTVPAGFGAVVACLRAVKITPRTLETILLALGGGAMAGDMLLRFFPTSMILSFAVLLLLRGLGMAGSKREGPLLVDLAWGGWLVSVAGGLGFLLSWLYFGFYGMLALGAGVFLWYRRTHPGAPMPPTTVLLCALSIGLTVSTFADDGSFDEFSPRAGGPKTISGYLETKDGQKLVGLGMIGGSLAALGSIFGSLFGTMLGNSFKEQIRLLQGAVPPPIPNAPLPPPASVMHRDGDTNELGEVWSSFSGGYVGRKTYDQDMASRAALAAKDRSDLADMQRPDEDVAELQRKIAETRRQGTEMRTYFKARDELLGALGDQRRSEGVDTLLDESRSGLFDELSDRLLTTPAGNDYRKGLEGLLPLADVIGNQMRPGYTPTYTYKDAAQDTLLQSGAAALDAILTKGWASSVVGSSLAMRDAARAGGGVLDIATAGAKSAVTDLLFGKAIHYGAGYAGEAWRAGKKAVAGIAESGTDLLAQASRRSKVATDLVEKMRRNMTTLENGVHVDGSGRMRASLTDVLEVQKNPHQVRALKQSGSASTQEAFNNTLRNEVYKPHDQMLLERLRKSSPELADKKLVVHEFRTPGKTASPINTDRDFRVLMQDSKGKWVEVSKTKWEQHSNDAFSELTFFDKSKCPKGMDPAQQKAWWAEQHGHTPTDRAFREAGRDYSDQIADLRTGQRGNLLGGEVAGTGTTRIAELKDIAAKAKDIAEGKVPPPPHPVKLADPQGLAQQFHEKVTGNLRRGDPFEAIAQAQKGVDTLDTVRKAYGAQNIPVGELPGNLRQAMDLVKDSNLPLHPHAAVLHTLEGKLEGLGFSDLGDFSHQLSSQFEGLKWTP